VISNGQLFYKTKHVPGADGKKPFTELPPAPPLPMHQFLNAVAGQKDQPLVTPHEAAARVRVMEACYEASRHGKWVKIG